MKRIYACIAIVAVLLSVAFYSSWKVQSFADVISADLDTAAEAIRNADYPAARQALADGADRCDQMRTKMNHLLRTADFMSYTPPDISDFLNFFSVRQISLSVPVS